MTKEEITYEDFAKIDFRTAKILEVEEIPDADKLYKITLNDNRTIVSGLKDSHTKEDLIGKTIIIIANLAPRKLRGVESNGMLLAADDNGEPILLTTEKKCSSNKEIN